MSDVASVLIQWAPGFQGRPTAVAVHILESGWLRVRWSATSVTYVPAHAVRELAGKGVIISDK